MQKIQSTVLMRILLSLLALWVIPLSAQDPQFTSPLEAEYGEDYIIVNYVDWGGSIDAQCGTKTYPDHQGTDMVLRSFRQMDSGVYVLAADTGTVTYIHDGEYDRNTRSVPALGFGNYIAIRHPNKMYSYYAHLKKNSVRVQVGDRVSPGQRIAQVGSSGNSTDPHLHFETWFDSLYLVDPFHGPCGNPTSRWLDETPYDTQYHLWEAGMVDFIPTIDSLRFRVQERREFTPSDTIICFWALQHGLRRGATSKIIWKTPTGQPWFTFRNTYQRDWWYYYYFTYIPFPENPQWGEWTAELYYEDSLVHIHPFTLVPSLATSGKGSRSFTLKYKRVGSRLSLVLSDSGEHPHVSLHGLDGRPLSIQVNTSPDRLQITPHCAAPQLCILLVRTSRGTRAFKVYL